MIFFLFCPSWFVSACTEYLDFDSLSTSWSWFMDLRILLSVCLYFWFAWFPLDPWICESFLSCVFTPDCLIFSKLIFFPFWLLQWFVDWSQQIILLFQLYSWFPCILDNPSGANPDVPAHKRIFVNLSLCKTIRGLTSCYLLYGIVLLVLLILRFWNRKVFILLYDPSYLFKGSIWHG